MITVPKMNYIALRGKGNPNEVGGAYQQAIGILYAIAYTMTFMIFMAFIVNIWLYFR